MLSLAGGKSVARPAYVVTLGLGVLLVVLTAALFKTGVLELPGSNTWTWATAGAGSGGGGISQQSATSSGDVAAAVAAAVQSRLDESLKQSEARIEAKLLKDLQLQSGGGLGGGATGSGYYDTYPNSDIDKLLAKYPAGSREQRELRARRYCSSAAEDPAGGSGTSEENIVWVPTPGKHVLLVCEYGQMSNKLNCLRNTMLLAALLNRTLVVPELEGPPRHYNYTLMVDAAHARQCIAGNASEAAAPPPPTVVTLGEYMAGLTTSETPARLPRPAAARVDSVWCWRDACALDAYARMLPGVTFPATVSAAAVRRKVTAVTDLRVLFGDLPDGVIAFGNTFNMRRIGGVPPAAWTAPNLPLFSQGSLDGPGNHTSRCRLLVQPHPALVVAAKGLVKTVLGRRYMAVHLRRGDFHNYWAPYCVRDAGANRARNTSFATAGCKLLDMAAIADCILEKLQGTGLSVVYVASNAAPPEADLLDGLLRANPRGGPPVTVVRAPLPLSGSSSKDNNKFLWAKDWRDMGLDANPQARAVLDKLVCAMAHTFMGSPSSTFTDDIVAMRAGLGTLTCHDQDVCAVYALEPSDLLPDFNITYTDNYQGTRHYRRRLRRRRLR